VHHTYLISGIMIGATCVKVGASVLSIKGDPSNLGNGGRGSGDKRGARFVFCA
jgi:hypothetical protein